MNNKKTPADFASTPAHKAVNALVAITALAGMASNMAPSAHAADDSQATYNPATQKSVGVDGLEMITYTTVNTNSISGSPDDTKTTSDQF